MQIVIDILEDRYKDIQRIAEVQLENCHFKTAEQIIANGTPLPKIHGRLIDADELLKVMDTWDKFGFEHTGQFVRNPKDDFIKYAHCDDMVISVKSAKTIIKADKETT